MKPIANWKKTLPLVLVGGMIPAILLLSGDYGWPTRVLVPLVTMLSLIFAAMALWAFANRHTVGSEWWQDDTASGWRGY